MPMVRRVLVTGGQQGLGLAIASKLLDEYSDCQVVIGALDVRIAEAAVSCLVEMSTSNASRIEVVPLDVTDDESVSQAANHVAAKFGRRPPPLHGIVNNAGINSGTMEQVLQVNIWGPWRVCNAFIPLLNPAGGRIVNVSSGGAAQYLAKCSPEWVKRFIDPSITWERITRLMMELVSLASAGPEAKEQLTGKGFGSGNPYYGASKALVNAYTQLLARQFPNLCVNSCTPGNTKTPMTEPYIRRSGKSPAELGFHSAERGARTPCFLIMGEPEGQGWFYGSDGERSPLATYRKPGSPPYNGPSPFPKL